MGERKRSGLVCRRLERPSSPCWFVVIFHAARGFFISVGPGEEDGEEGEEGR